MRVGILGGTFDPVHLGHLIIAEEARVRLKLDRVIFIPTGHPWLKEQQPVASGADRLRMVELAIVSNSAFQVASNEVDRSGPTYTVDTLQELAKELGSDAVLHFILGMDALEQFDRWKEPEKLLGLCHLAIVNRPGHQAVDVNDLVERYPQAGTRLTLVNVPRIEISSTEIRRRVAEGVSIRYLVPDAVEGYISQHGLYQ
ncbi:MAG: nicotinate-nucleotide adenylyltransferase [Chloroflexi bacterium]|nr:nicotinate-nucleotide adenylyltransferase [Chloroflexota bacterium]MDA1219140.1 nicotinate-nucleotide adenylyltransferase [Chloroflexota bacterium]